MAKIKAEAKVDEEEGEVNLVIDKETAEKLLMLAEKVEKVKKGFNVDWGKIVEKLIGTESEIVLTFDKLTIDGAIKVKIVPMKKE